MLELKDVHTFYGLSHVLHGVSISVGKGDVVSVMGRNGAGKTTLMHTIIGLVRAKEGRISFNGTDITQLEPHLISRLGIKLVPQGRRVFPKLTIEENLRLALVGQKGVIESNELNKVYGLFPVLKERKSQKVKGLSGGERQMLAIARGLLGNTVALLMDEPTEGLAPIVVKRLHSIILDIKQFDITILLAEQNVRMALLSCDHHYVMEKGEIRFSGSTEAILANGDLMIQTLGVSG